MISPPAITADIFDEVIDYFTRLPDIADTAMSLALNDTARGEALQMARKQILEEVAYPAGYLKSRLVVSKFAKPNDLEVAISGRDRPTSLARFATNARAGQRGIRVEVGRGNTVQLKKAFIIKLNNGNLGLAIRLAPGEQLINRNLTTSSRSLGGNVVLLYGPSIDQVFKGVADDIQPAVADAAVAEFFRQFTRLSDG